MKICIAGKNKIAVEALNHLIIELGYRVDNLLVCSNKNDNGVDSWQPSLKKKAEDMKVHDAELTELYDITDLVFISLEFDRIIKPDRFSSRRLFNIHFSLLPKYKGMYTSVFPLLNGEAESGVTLHFIDEGIDTGDIIDQLKFSIGLNDTCRDLYFKYLETGLKLFKKNINNLLSSNIVGKQQPSVSSTYYSKRSLDFKNISIDFNKTSFEIHNQIRAFIFKEYQLPIIHSYRITKSILTNDKIKMNYFGDEAKNIIISGIDGYKIELETDHD